MGAELVIAGLATAVSAGAGIASGIQGARAADKQEKALKDQAAIQRLEANEDASERRREARLAAARQGLAFLKSGVTLSGSAALLQQSTLRRGEREAKATERRGSALRRRSLTEAAVARGSGRTALIGGIGRVASAASTFAVQKKQLGN